MQSLSFASLKVGAHDPKCKNQSLKFCTMKAEMNEKEKTKIQADKCNSLTSAEIIGGHILKRA